MPNVGVVFLLKRFTNVVPNKLYIEVCDMINGVNSSDYIIKQLSDKHKIGEIHFILSELERKNYIQENTKTTSLISCFDHQINDFFKSDVLMLSEINLINISEIDDKIYQDLLNTYNIKINNQDDYTLVITDNYLDKRLAMLASKKKWFICKPTESIIFISSIFPATIVQLCIVHMVRNSVKYVSYKDLKEVTTDLK